MDRPFTSALPLLIAIALAAVSTTGCKNLTAHNWRGRGYGEDINALTENLRPPADEAQMTGFDQRARDIERNLGVR